MKKLLVLLLPLLLFAPTRTFYCDHGWGYYYWLFGPIGPNQSEGMAAAGYQTLEYRGYVQFNLYSYPGSNTAINSLVLRLRNNTGGSGLQVDLNRVVSQTPGWDECGNTPPIYATNLAVNASPEQYSYLDFTNAQAITDFLGAWETGTWFGLGMKGSRGSGEPCMHFFYAFWASEIYDAALLVDYGIVGVDERQTPGSKIQTPRIVCSPNPARGIVDIAVSGMKNGVAEDKQIMIYNSSGQNIRTIFLPSVYCSRSAVSWDCRDAMNRQVPPGVYFVTFTSDQEQVVEKLILLR